MKASEIKNNLADKRAEETAVIAKHLEAIPPLKKEALHMEYAAAEMAGELTEG